jgi:hypothetical protein
LERVELPHLQPVALRLLTALLFYMLTAAVLEAEAVVAVPLGLAAEMVAQVGRRLMVARLAVLVDILVMVAVAQEIMVAQRLVRQVLVAVAVAAVAPGLIMLKPVVVG